MLAGIFRSRLIVGSEGTRDHILKSRDKKQTMNIRAPSPGPTFSDFLAGSLPAASGRKMRFTGTTVLRVENGKIAEEIGLDDGVTALQQLGVL